MTKPSTTDSVCRLEASLALLEDHLYSSPPNVLTPRKWEPSERSQTEMQYRCSVVQCTLQVYCVQNSVAAVYTAHALYHTLQFAGHPACTLPRHNKFVALYTAYCTHTGKKLDGPWSALVPTVASETLEGMFLVNNSPNTQCRALKPYLFALLSTMTYFFYTRLRELVSLVSMHLLLKKIP